jgi:hypothetical protein
LRVVYITFISACSVLAFALITDYRVHSYFLAVSIPGCIEFLEMALLSRLGVHGTSVSEIRGNPLLLLDSDSVRAFVRLHKFFSRDRSTSTLAFRILCLFSTDVNDIVVGWEGSCTKERRTIGRHCLFSNRNLPSHHRFTLIVD